MSDLTIGNWQVGAQRLAELVRRCELSPLLLRRSIEEEIVVLVDLPQAEQDQLLNKFCEEQQLQDPMALEDWQRQKGWCRDDLIQHLIRPVAIRLFAEQRYGPGIEEYFLSRKNDLDVAVYSLLRVRDAGLARELWIQLSEQEITFAEAASRYSDGPEATTKGVIGPVRLGAIEPQLAHRLRSLRAGEIKAPEAMGGWNVLLRLEQLTPARLDAAMRETLLNEQFDSWIQQRAAESSVNSMQEPLNYHRDP